MKIIFIVILLSITSFCFSQKENQLKIKKGNWTSKLMLNDNDCLPFFMTVKRKNKIVIQNAEEKIILSSTTTHGDTLHAKFPFFNSELVFAVNGKRLDGYWVNYNKSADYKIPFSSIRKKTSRFSFISKKDPSININGNWEVAFEPNTTSEYPAIGIFKQENKSNKVKGTFLTETGDYRFLEGNCSNDSLYLSCFDGSHAFLFKAGLSNNILSGDFYSGSHWRSKWTGEVNDTFQLTPPNELTQIVNQDELKLSLPNLNKDTVSFPGKEFDNKVVIIQIMGTWCPNCLDESKYYKELYSKYHDKGLEIISVCYEVGNSIDDYIINVNRLKNKLDLDFTFLIGGSAKKDLASQHFNSLSDIISFPTSIFIDRTGKIKSIHTGFNGPGTGEYYESYKVEVNRLIKSMLIH